MMLQTTTPTVEGHPIKEYKGIVSAQSIIGANVLKDFMAGMRDFFGGRSKAYEAIVKGDPMPTPGIPESLNVLLHELRGLGLNISLE